MIKYVPRLSGAKYPVRDNGITGKHCGVVRLFDSVGMQMRHTNCLRMMQKCRV